MEMGSKINFKKLLILLYGFLIFLIYISTINNSEGLEYDASNIANWANRGMFIFPHQQNHLLQGILNMAWCKAWKFFGYTKDCLMPLRVLSCIFGAIGVVGFFILLHKIFKKNIIASFGSLGLAFSVLYWGFSTDLETHLLPTAIFIYCLLLLFDLEKFNRNKLLLLGFIHSICIYLSGIYIFFIPAIISGIVTVKGASLDKYKAVGWYLFSLLIFWVMPFLIIGMHFYKAYSDFRYADNVMRHLFIWFRGFERLIPFSGLNLVKIPACYFNVIHPITQLGNMIILGIGIIFLNFYIMAFLMFIRNRRNIINKFSRVILIALNIIIPYQVVLLIYEPLNIQRYTHFVSAFWLLLSCAVSLLFMSKKKLLLMPFIFIALLFFVNLIFYIYPRHLVVLGPVREYKLQRLILRADNLYKLGRYNEAAEAFNKANEVLITTFGHNRPEVATGFDKLANVYEKMQRVDEAAFLRSKANKIRLR